MILLICGIVGVFSGLYSLINRSGLRGWIFGVQFLAYGLALCLLSIGYRDKLAAEVQELSLVILLAGAGVSVIVYFFVLRLSGARRELPGARQELTQEPQR